MAKHIGIVACSAEGAALCYRTICKEAPSLMGEEMHPEITMHTHPLGNYMKLIRSGDWDGVGDLMFSSARILAKAGAGVAVCPGNTIPPAVGRVEEASPLPWLPIAEVVAREARKRGFTRLGITGTSFLMTGPVYPEKLAAHGISSEIPDEDDRERIDRIIFSELVNGVFTEESRLIFNDVIGRLGEKGCRAAVLGCTEIPLLVDPGDCPLPVLDSTRLLARAALEKALGDNK